MEDVLRATIETELANQSGPPPRPHTGCCGPCRWWGEKPCKRWRFILFFLCGFCTIIWFIMYITQPWNPQSYIYGSLVVIVMSIWAIAHFRILTRLTEQVDKSFRLNKSFKDQNKKLRGDVITLARTQRHLNGVQNKLKTMNDKLQQNIVKFQKLDKNLRTISDSNIKGIEKLQKKSKNVVDAMHSSQIMHEKSILHSVYESLEFDNNMSGLSKEQFDEFWKRLPKSYYRRWCKTGKTFDELAGDNGTLDYKEFASMADSFAKQEATAGGSNNQ